MVQTILRDYGILIFLQRPCLAKLTILNTSEEFVVVTILSLLGQWLRESREKWDLLGGLLSDAPWVLTAVLRQVLMSAALSVTTLVLTSLQLCQNLGRYIRVRVQPHIIVLVKVQRRRAAIARLLEYSLCFAPPLIIAILALFGSSIIAGYCHRLAPSVRLWADFDREVTWWALRISLRLRILIYRAHVLNLRRKCVVERRIEHRLVSARHLSI